MFLFKRKKNRKWQERPVLYKGRFFYLRQVAQILLVAFGLLLILSGYLYFKNSSSMMVRTVEVTGGIKHLSVQNVIDLSEIKQTDTLFSVRLHQIQKNVLRHPWVREVRVRREFPDTIQIFVKEFEPVALLHVEGWYLVDGRGIVFKKMGGHDPKDLPIISGLKRQDIQDHPYLSRQALQTCLGFLQFLGQQAFYRDDPVSEIVYDEIFGMTVFTQNRGLEVYYGQNSFEQKQAQLEKFKLFSIFRLQNFVRLDLDSPGRVIGRTL
jgi:cell division protein FtsQ